VEVSETLRETCYLTGQKRAASVGTLVAKEGDGGSQMKKIPATLVSLVVLSLSALPAAAQTRGRCATNQTTYSRYDDRYNRNTSYDPRYDSNIYRNDQAVYQNNSYGYDNRSVWQKHRDKITTAGGAAAGAVLGGLIGGKKGAIIGAVTGGAGAAVYTYKIRDRYRRY
jgi:hypothetical protein